MAQVPVTAAIRSRAQALAAAAREHAAAAR
jgi:hypothetical protein